jgi:VIT1/CCC1 family predicted Fe2+/Mn2+ transporter
MPQTEHVEKHFKSSEAVRDIVIGMSDGLTVPFALAAGLSGAVTAVRIVITAGLAEIAAGSIAMGLGGYLAARSDAEHYANEEAREHREVREQAEEEEAEVERVFESYGLTKEQSAPIVDALRRLCREWLEKQEQTNLGEPLAVQPPEEAAASEVLAEMEALAQSRELRLQLHVEGVVKVCVNPERLREALQGLLAWVIQNSAGSGAIAIKLSAADGVARVFLSPPRLDLQYLQIKMLEDITTPGDHPDVLVAMNPAALKTNLSLLKRGGAIIANEWVSAHQALGRNDK